MPHDTGRNAEIDALNAVASAVVDLLGRLRDTQAPEGRAALKAEFAARVDGLRADLRRHHGLDDQHAGAILARALAHVGELGRGAPPCD